MPERADKQAKQQVDTSHSRDVQTDELSGLDRFYAMQRAIKKPDGETLAPDTILQLQRTIGNHAVKQLLATPETVPTHTVQRQGGNVASHHDFVDVTIHYLKLYTKTDQINKSSFEWTINNSYAAVVKAEKIIDEKLAGDAQQRTKLRKAYRGAMNNYMPRAAQALGKDLSDLYNENRGRIPMWAWQVPHHKESGISTPIPQGAAADPSTGEVDMTIHGIPVKILPDSTDPSLGNKAETNFKYHTTGQFKWKQKNGNVTEITSQPHISITIKTVYGDNVTASSPSAYGRGTTAEDKAGAQVTPESSSLGFHEGSHGFDYIQLLQKTPPPQFTGTVGMTVNNFKAAATKFKNEWDNYIKEIDNKSDQRTDEVGTKKSSLNAGSNP